MSLKLLSITLILALSILLAVGGVDRAESQEIEPNEFIPHKNLAIGYVIGRDGTLTAIVGLDTFTVSIPQIANHFWQSITKTIVNENITTIEYLNGQNIVTLTLNMTDNILHFDLEGRLIEANLLSFQFSENTKRLGENRTGLRLANGRLFYFDWEDIDLQTEFIEASKSLRIDIRSAPTFKLDPRVSITNPDFETGDFTGWGTTCISGAQEVNSSLAINGSFSHRVRSNAGSPGGQCFASNDQPADNEYFIRFQLRIELNEMADTNVKDIAQIDRTGSLRSKVRLIQNDTLGGLEFTIRYLDDIGANTHRNHTFPAIELETTYCIEFSYDRDNTGPDLGAVTAHVNNTQFMDITIDNDMLPVPNRIVSGQPGGEDTGKMIFRTDDWYQENAVRLANCPEGLGPVGPPVPSLLVLSTLAPIGPQIMLVFILLALVALGQSNPWFVIGGWVSISIAFGMSLSPAYVALDANNNPVTFIQAFPTDWSVWLFRFFIIMQFVYPMRILALVWERLIKLISSLKDRFG